MAAIARFYLASLLLLLPVVDSHVLKSSQTVAIPPNLQRIKRDMNRKIHARNLKLLESTKDPCKDKQSCFQCVQTHNTQDGRKCVYVMKKGHPDQCRPGNYVKETNEGVAKTHKRCVAIWKYDTQQKISKRHLRLLRTNVQAELYKAQSLGTKIKDASVDPRMEPYNKHYALEVHDFQDITGNLGYCWRFATAQALGIPYLMYEKMVGTIQEHVKEKGLPASFGRKKLCAHNDKNCAHNKENWGPAKDSFEASEVLTKPLSVYKREDLDTYDPAGNPSNMIFALQHFVKERPHVPLYDASKLQKFKNRLLYEDTRAENMNADKLNTVLRNLIECVKVEEFERPTLDSIASFFAATPTQKKTGVPIKNKERRVLFQIVHGWSHYAVLSPSTDGTVQHLHYADGNGLSNDGQVEDFYEGAEHNTDIFERFKKWTKLYPDLPPKKDQDPKKWYFPHFYKVIRDFC